MSGRQVVINARPYDSAAGTVGPLSAIVIEGDRIADVLPGSPRIDADIDRDRAQLLGVQPSQIYEALGTYLGSTYVNDFNLLGRTFRVTAQAEPSARDDLADIGQLQVRSAGGEMVPLASVATHVADRSIPRPIANARKSTTCSSDAVPER